MAVRVNAQKTVSAEMCRGRAGVAGAYGKCWAQQRPERAVNRGENVFFFLIAHPRGEPEQPKTRQR
jgi:hypothetical protein